MATYTINNGNILKITRPNGDVYWLPNPNEMEVAVQDIDSDSAGRSASGLMFRDRVATKKKISCSFPPMNASDMNSTLTAMQDQFFTLEFPDITGVRTTITAYVGDRTAQSYRVVSGVPTLWTSLSANFVER